MPLRVVLVSPRNPLNIGAAARAMSNFGFHALRVVNPYEVAFREARSAVGAGAVLEAAEEFRSVADAVSDASVVVGTTSVGHRELQHTLRRLEPAAKLIRRELSAGGSVALLFGSEKFGLSNDDMAHCHWLLRIPTSEHGSMNLGQAVAVCLYELVRSGRVPAGPKKRKATSAGEIEQITRMLIDVCTGTGYINPVVAVSTSNKIRRMMRRLSINPSDAALWLGILRQALWKLRP